MHTTTQLYLFTPPAQQLRTKRTYCQHRRRTVVFLQRNYCRYTLKELAALLRLSERQVFGLCRRNGIRKRALNKAKTHIPQLAVAA